MLFALVVTVTGNVWQASVPGQCSATRRMNAGHEAYRPYPWRVAEHCPGTLA